MLITRKKLGALYGAALTALLLTGCSDEPSNNNTSKNNADPCAGVVCADGVCDPTTKQCVNPASCADDDACLAGFICEASACVDDPCTTDAGSPTCSRGTCERGTGVCQNASSCTPDTAGVRCLEEFVCFNLECTSAASVCADLNCEARRGVCDPVAQACVAATDCAGSDQKCLAGSYCAPDNSCKPNACDIAMKTCPRGVCDAASAECVNAPTCDAATDCIDGNLCIAGACTPAAQACGASGCPGNQLCQYNEAALSVSCVEDAAEGCEDARDCVGARVCTSGACAEPVACDADKYEPNNTAAAATDLAAEDNLASGTLCAGDADVFKLAVALPQGQLSSQLVFDIVTPRAAIGLGTIKAELRSPQGAVVATAETVANGQPTNSLRLSYEINPTRQGEYTLTLTGQVGASVAGVRYDLRADFVTQETLAACQAARPITPNQLVNGNFAQQASTGLASSCGGDTDGSLPENVWTFTLTEPQYVEFEARPSNSALDLALSLRGDCLRAVTELNGACLGAPAAPGAIRTLRTTLEPGSYALIVEARGSTAAPYTLIFTAQDVVCNGETSCVDDTRRRYCAPSGAGFIEETCTNGCLAATGFCDAAPGDACSNPIVVDPVTGFQGSIPIRSFSRKLDPGQGACLPNSTTNSSTLYDSRTNSNGSDVIFQVTLEPNQSVKADFTRGSHYISAYLLTDCADTSSCVAGANVNYTTSESLFYVNQTLTPQTYLLVLDSDTKPATATTNVTANIQINDYVCTPGAKRCVRGRESQVCEPFGTGYSLVTACAAGCDAATGECTAFPYDTCDGALTLTPGVPRTESLASFTSNDAPVSPCSTSGVGRDAVYRLAGVPPASTVRVEMTANFNAFLWLADTCDVPAKKIAGCLQSANVDTTGNSPETLEFFTATGGDFFIVADTTSSTTAAGSFTIVANVIPPGCQPGERYACVDATSLEFCNSSGTRISYACSGGCTNNAQGEGVCGTHIGDVCADAIPLVGQSGTTASTNLQAVGRTNALTYPDGRVDRCYLDRTSDDTTGRDTFYSVDLQAGEQLTVTMSASSASAMLFLSENCDSLASCIGYYNARPASATVANPNVQTIRYRAPVAQTIFVIVDSQLTSSATTVVNYTLSWQIDPGTACVPNTSRCLNSTTLLVCDGVGGAERQVACPAGCLGDACAPVPAASLCSTAPLIQPGTYVVTDLIGQGSEVNLAADECVGATTAGNDIFYRIDAQAGQLVTARLVSYGEETIGLALIKDCADAGGSCVAGGRTQSGNSPTWTTDISYLATQAETLYLMVDGTSTGTSSDEGVGLSFDVRSPNCQPGEPNSCFDANTVQRCSAAGVLETVSCGARTCTNGLCDSPIADTCVDPIFLTGPSGVVNSSFADKTSNISPAPGRNAACLFDSAGVPTGRDAIYAVDLAAGDLFEAELTSAASSWVYILDSCTTAQAACVANHLRSGDGNRKVAYVAPQAGRYFVVVDTSSATSTDAYALDWSVTPGKQCAPDRWSCLDADTVGRCAADGAGYVTTYACANGCANGACVVDQRALDTCGSNMLVQRNATSNNGLEGGFYGFYNLNGLTNDRSVTSGTCGNFATTSGRDQFIEIPLQPNEVVTATAVGMGKIVNLQFLDDCAAQTCLAGMQNSSTAVGAPSRLSYQAGATPETVVLVLDSTATAADEPIELEISIRSQFCNPGQPSACQGDSVVYCTALGTQETYSCGGRGCTSGACNNPTGETCLEAQPLPGASGAITGTFDNAQTDLNPGEGHTGACFFDEEDDPLGRDLVYAIDLNVGDQLTAEITNIASSSSTADTTTWLYAVTDCLDERTSCAANHYESGDGNRKITYVATEARRVFLVVDSESATSTGTFTLAWSVMPNKLCTPNRWTCLDDTTIALCNAAGNTLTRVIQCPGACAGDSCVVEQGQYDTCGASPALPRNATPINGVVSGLVTWPSFERGTNSLAFTASSCVGVATAARETIYRVDLEPEEILDATVYARSEEVVALAIVRDCLAAEASCISGGNSDVSVSRTYQAGATAETVYVIVDASLSTSDEAHQVEIVVRGPNCTPGVTATTCNVSGDALVYCNARGFLTEYACDGTCTGAACDEPRADLCLDPEWLNPAGSMMSAMYSVSGMLADYTDDYDLTPGNTCLALSSPTNGRDAIFRLDLAAGQTANVSVTSTEATPEDLTLYVLNPNGCVPNISTCLVGADNLDASSSPETLTYTAAAAQTVYIVVDSFFAATAGAFTLDVTVQ